MFCDFFLFPLQIIVTLNKNMHVFLLIYWAYYGHSRGGDSNLEYVKLHSLCGWNSLFMCMIQMVMILLLFHFWICIMSWFFCRFLEQLEGLEDFFAKEYLLGWNICRTSGICCVTSGREFYQVGCFLQIWNWRLSVLVSNGYSISWVYYWGSLGGNNRT